VKAHLPGILAWARPRIRALGIRFGVQAGEACARLSDSTERSR